MRTLIALLVASWLAAAQTDAGTASHAQAATASPAASQLTIPAGTKVPIALKHAVSTKGAREGDSVYAETTFPVVLNDRVLIPAGTYVQGRISQVQRGGRI